MNQILFNGTNYNNQKKKDLRKFRFIFVFSLILTIVLFLYYIYNYFNSSNKENISSSLLNTFNLQRLYSDSDSYTSISLNDNKDFFVIGNIEIPSIKINYPILSNISDELLKISLCRFYGPYPNEVGNLCIAGHNYNDDRFFSNLDKLNIGEQINIYDSKNSMISYVIYDKYETNINDTLCTSQDTAGEKEITLVTCNNLNGNRLIIKAINKDHFK